MLRMILPVFKPNTKNVSPMSRLLAAVVFGLVATSSHGDVLYWDNDSGDNDWFNPLNWSGDVAPENTHDLLIETGQPTTSEYVSITRGGSISIRSAKALLEALTIASYLTGELNISDGGHLHTESTLIGLTQDAEGIVNVDGPGTTWASMNSVSIGNHGYGEINITDGGRVSGNNTTRLGELETGFGKLIVDGQDSLWRNLSLIVGDEGYGRIEALNGAIIETANINLGLNPGSSGSGLATGQGSILESGNITVGHHGIGQLSVLDGAVVNSNQTILGYEPGSNGELEICDAGTEFTVSFAARSSPGKLVAGFQGEGKVSVIDGAKLTSSYGVIADRAGSSGNVLVFGAGSVWTNQSDDLYGSNHLYVGKGGHGELAIIGGATVRNDSAFVGYETGSYGMVTVDGRDSIWLNAGSVNIGSSSLMRKAQGEVTLSNYAVASAVDTLRIDNQSILTVGDTASITVDHIAKLVHNGVVVGFEGDGRMDIENSSKLVDHTLVDSTVGYGTGSHGVVNIRGEGSSWTTENGLIVGKYGMGEIHISDGGLLEMQGMSLGSSTGSMGVMTVDGPDSRIKATTTGIGVGVYGQGVFEITNGAEVESYTGGLGSTSTGRGTVIIDGIGSHWNLSIDLNVGINGQGNLWITNGATVFATHARLGKGYDGRGEMVVDGKGSALNFHSLFIGGYSALDPRGEGLLIVRNGGHLNGTRYPRHITIWQKGVLAGDGLVTADVKNYGVVAPGEAGGILTIEGDYVQDADGILAIDLRPSDELASEMLSLVTTHYSYNPNGGPPIPNGKATLDGTLDLRVKDNQLILPGETFTVMEYARREGEFSEVVDDSIFEGLWFEVVYHDRAAAVVAMALPGDANLDGKVNLVDLNMLGAHFGKADDALWLHGDFNHDAVVSLLDLDLMGQHYGQTVATPEPCGLVVLAAMSSVISCRRRSLP